MTPPSKAAARKRKSPPETPAEKAARLRKLKCTWKHETTARDAGATRIAGVDEVGRGALFGPVVAAAVILPFGCKIDGLRDSKQLPVSERERLAEEVKACAVAYAVAEIDSITIDRVNIYQATRLAMLAAVGQLALTPDFLLIDAMRIEHNCPQQSLIYGDALSVSIAAASVVAKVYRDTLMCRMDLEYPDYGLASHKGYCTPQHLEALRLLGPTPHHRKSYSPIQQYELFL